MGLWTYRNHETGVVRTEDLKLRWSLDRSAMSDNFYFAEKDAFELFDEWASEENDDLLTVFWGVEPEGESAPYQVNAFSDGETFLSFWTHPVDAATGAPLNWLALPVLDGSWNARETTSGGFIQEATGWKPSALQPTVSLRALRAAADVRRGG